MTEATPETTVMKSPVTLQGRVLATACAAMAHQLSVMSPGTPLWLRHEDILTRLGAGQLDGESTCINIIHDAVLVRDALKAYLKDRKSSDRRQHPSVVIVLIATHYGKYSHIGGWHLAEIIGEIGDAITEESIGNEIDAAVSEAIDRHL